MKREIKWIEICRTLAMAMIVFVHVIDLAYNQKGGKPNFGTSLTVVFYFTVPLFFMVSGLLLR